MAETNITQTIEEASSNFDSAQFAVLTLSFGVPMLAILAGAAAFLHLAVQYNLARTRSWLAFRFTDEESFKSMSFPLSIVVMVVFGLVPSILLFVWGGYTAATLPPAVIGVAIIFCGIVLFVTCYAVIYWWSLNWRMTTVTLALLVISFATFCLFEIVTTLLVTPFTYIGLSAVFVSLNMIPMIYLVYLFAPGKRLEFGDYVKETISDSLVDDLEPDPDIAFSRNIKGAVAYMLAIAFLIAHSGLSGFLAEDPRQVFVGFFTLLAVLVLDVVVGLLHHAHLVQDPVVLSLLMIFIRGSLIITGARFWFIGHCVVFVLASVVLGVNAVNYYFPRAKSKTSAQQAALAGPVKELLKIVELENSELLGHITQEDPEETAASKRKIPTGVDAIIQRREFILGFLAIFFVLDLIAVRVFGSSLDPIVMSSPHQQWLFGVAALIMSLIVPAAYLANRLYQRSGYEVERNVLIAVGGVEVAVFGSGIFFFILSKSYIVLFLAIFLPLIVVLGVITYRQWVKNDYDMFIWPDSGTGAAGSGDGSADGDGNGAAATSHPTTEEMWDFVYLKAPVPHYIMFFGPILFLLLTLALSVSVTFTAPPPFVGWTLGAVIAIPTFTFVPVQKYFNTFELNMFVYVTAGFGQLLVVLYSVLVWTLAFNSAFNLSALGLLFFAVLYPTLSVFFVAVYKWRDDKWVVSNGIKYVFGGCFVVVLVFVILTMVFFNLGVGIGLLFVLILVTYFVVLALVWVTNDFYLPRPFKYSTLAVAVLFIVLGVAIGLVTRAFFIGFSVSWGCLFVVASLYAGTTFWQVSRSESRFQFSRFIFPVYHYNSKTDEIEAANLPVVAAFVAVSLAIVWGILASIFLTPFFIGFAVTSLGLALFVMLTAHLLWTPSRVFGRALQYLTPELLEKSRVEAKSHQLGGFEQVDNEGEFAGAGGVGSADDDDVETGGGTSGKSCAELLKEVAEFEAILSKGETAVGPDGQSYGPLEGYRKLFDFDKQVNIVFSEEQRFATFFQFLTVMSTQSLRQRAEAQIRDMVVATGYADTTASDISNWGAEEKAAFTAAFRKYLDEQKAAMDKIERNKEFDEEKARERERRMREAEERRLAELAREHAGDEAERIAALEAQRAAEEAEAERRRAEAAAAEAEAARAAEEAERQRREAELAQAELEARLAEQAEEAERERIAAELAAQREAEARRLAEEQARREAEERRLAEEQARLAEEARRRAEIEAELEAQRRAAEAKIREKTTVVGEVDVDGLINQLVSNGEVYVDREFPASGRALYFSGNDTEPGKQEITAWMRPPEFVDTSQHEIVVFGEDGADGEPAINADDIAQGALGDCWFLSALSVLAQQPDLVKAVFQTDVPNAAGVYGMQFHKNGKLVQVVVDDQIPCVYNRPAYASSKQEGELWVMLLEKAYAKLHHSYEAIEGGLVHLALVDLTGGASESIGMDDGEVQRDIASGRLWTKLLKYQELGYLMGAGSPAGSDTDISSWGIVQGHAYALLDVKEVDGIRLLNLRNPWGQTEWKGDWSDDSDLWTRRMKSKVRYVQSDDGAFWMSFEDFTVHFRNIYVCRTFPSSWKCVTVESEWRGPTAGGCPNFPTASSNPQFYLTISKPTNLFIVLAQEETRGTGRDEFHIGFMVVDKGGKRVKKLYKGERVGGSGQYINRREVSCEIQLDPKPYPYTIFVSTFNAGDEASFSLICHSDVDVGLVLAPADDPED